ncbi:MAG: hypothetical protein RJA70_4685 [Pseudomonadota bacterium]|jgi:hypothetical protein
MYLRGLWVPIGNLLRSYAVELFPDNARLFSRVIHSAMSPAAPTPWGQNRRSPLSLGVSSDSGGATAAYVCVGRAVYPGQPTYGGITVSNVDRCVS